MKATGIVRRIDDLGRVVIPKEIRRTMRIREGDPLEIYTDREGEVIFKKYSPIGELTGFAAQYAETLHKTCDLNVVICDRDAVVACAGVSRKEYADRALSVELESLMSERGLYVWQEGAEAIPVVSGSMTLAVNCAMPILAGGDLIGCVASVRSLEEGARKSENGPAPELEVKLIQTAAGFLGRQLEE